jgi:hypothetical protein
MVAVDLLANAETESLDKLVQIAMTKELAVSSRRYDKKQSLDVEEEVTILAVTENPSCDSDHAAASEDERPRNSNAKSFRHRSNSPGQQNSYNYGEQSNDRYRSNSPGPQSSYNYGEPRNADRYRSNSPGPQSSYNYGERRNDRYRSNSPGLRSSYNHGEQRNYRQSASSNSRPFTCHNCGKPGHYARDCWSRRTNTSATSNGYRSSNRDNLPRTGCRHCGQMHWNSDCPFGNSGGRGSNRPTTRTNFSGYRSNTNNFNDARSGQRASNRSSAGQGYSNANVSRNVSFDSHPPQMMPPTQPSFTATSTPGAGTLTSNRGDTRRRDNEPRIYNNAPIRTIQHQRGYTEDYGDNETQLDLNPFDDTSSDPFNLN